MYNYNLLFYSLDTEIINKGYHKLMENIDKFNRILCKKS